MLKKIIFILFLLSTVFTFGQSRKINKINDESDLNAVSISEIKIVPSKRLKRRSHYRNRKFRADRLKNKCSKTCNKSKNKNIKK